VSESTYKKPLPRPNKLSAAYWEGTQQHELRIVHCTDCDHNFLPAADRCPKCLSKRVEWVRASGKGKVWSWVVFHQRYFPAFEAELPYNVAYVELEEGPRLMTNIIDCDPGDLRCDMPVEVIFDDVTPEISLPKFRPIREESVTGSR
jgi:uncharacterized OB-fold protein